MMPLKLQKSLFARNRSREKEFGDFFNKTSSGLSYIMALCITVFFTPALITTSLFSRGVIVVLANFSLSLGYLTNFTYRIYQNEVSKAELMVSSLTLVAFLIASYILFPPMAALSFISVLGFINQMAIAVNLFFLIKHVVVPPCKKFIENVAQSLGFNIAGRYYSKPPLTLENDRFIIDQLLINTYGHNSYSQEYDKKKLAGFNITLAKLSEYIDKYNESLLGYINNRDSIADLERQVVQLTTKGSSESSYAFIRKKIGFKTTKIQMLQAAKEVVTTILENPNQDATQALQFFSDIDINKVQTNRQQILSAGLECLEKEIQRQQYKIASLKDCLPIASVG